MNKYSEFKKWFKYYQSRFGLLGWDVRFEQKKLKDSYATISPNLDGMTALVTLDIETSAKEIKASARHEALHLLIGRLSGNASYRYASKEDMYETCEELVNKLCKLIK